MSAISYDLYNRLCLILYLVLPINKKIAGWLTGTSPKEELLTTGKWQ
jgi:hypothetical protein